MRVTRRSLPAAGVASPLWFRHGRAATACGRLVFGLSSYPPTMASRANAGTAAATAKLMFHRGLLGYGPEGALRGEIAETWEHTEDDVWVLVQQHLAEIGIQAELVLPDWPTSVTLGNRGQYEMVVMGSASEYNDPDGLTPFLAGNLSVSYVRSFGLDIPKIDELPAAGRAEFDDSKRHTIDDESQQQVLEQVPILTVS